MARCDLSAVLVKIKQPFSFLSCPIIDTSNNQSSSILMAKLERFLPRTDVSKCSCYL